MQPKYTRLLHLYFFSKLTYILKIRLTFLLFLDVAYYLDCRWGEISIPRWLLGDFPATETNFNLIIVTYVLCFLFYLL